MSGENGQSRRTFLRRIGGVSAVGLITGAGTHALVTESETFAGNSLRTRSLDLELAYEETDADAFSVGMSSTAQFSDADGVGVSLDELEPGTSRWLTVAFATRPTDRQAEVWTRVGSESDETELASEIRMRAAFYPDSDDTDTESSVWEGPVSEVLSESSDGHSVATLADGVALSGCTPAQVDDGGSPPCLSVEWWIPDDETVEPGSLSLAVDFAARQCSNTESAGENPWQS